MRLGGFTPVEPLSLAWAEVLSMTALSSLVPALQSELAVPGTFGDVFPDTGTNDLILSLANAYSMAKIDGFFSDMTLNTSDPVKTTWTVSPDFSESGGAITVIYAAMSIIRAQLRVLPTSSTYKAGSVEYSTSQAATILKGELDYLLQRRKDIVAAGARVARTCSAAVIDGYFARAFAGSYSGTSPLYDAGPGSGAWGGFFPYEYRA